MTTKPDPDALLTKRETLDMLGRSERTVQTYIADGRLPCSYVTGPNGKESRFRAADVARLKTDLEMPVHRALVQAQPQTVEMIPVRAVEALAPIAETIAGAVREALAGRARVKPWLTLAEASDYSGLPQSWLRAQALTGGYGAINVSAGTRARWMFSRNALKG